MDLLKFAPQAMGKCVLKAPDGSVLEVSKGKEMFVEVANKDSHKYKAANLARLRALQKAFDGKPDDYKLPEDEAKELDKQFAIGISGDVFVRIGNKTVTDAAEFFGNDDLWFFHSQVLEFAGNSENFLKA